MIAAALVLLAFVALCVGCAVYEWATRPADVPTFDGPDLDANIAARWQG